jgi:hypothetical protein
MASHGRLNANGTAAQRQQRAIANRKYFRPHRNIAGTAFVGVREPSRSARPAARQETAGTGFCIGVKVSVRWPARKWFRPKNGPKSKQSEEAARSAAVSAIHADFAAPVAGFVRIRVPESA